MYGMQDEYGAEDFFAMREIAREQNKLLQDILAMTENPVIMKLIASAVVKFHDRITKLSV